MAWAWWAWFFLELRDHIWPWSTEGWRSQRALQVAGLSLAVAATVAWGMAAVGSLSSDAIIAWWFGWSLYEVFIRLLGPPLREGRPLVARPLPRGRRDGHAELAGASRTC